MSSIAPSKEQTKLAALLGVDIGADTFDVAAARLLDAIAPAIGHEPRAPSSARQREFAASLGFDSSFDSKRVASAKINEALYVRNQNAIVALDLKPGDRVIRVEHYEIDGELQEFAQEFQVSSIHPNGRVFFKGGNGQGAWPTQLRKVHD